MLVNACGATEPVESGLPVQEPATDRFAGLWVVDQPGHALYEKTYYTFHPDGRLSTGRSEPPDCGMHLERHCVTGSVAKCERGVLEFCEGSPSCVFGDRWRSLGPSTLLIAGKCSDGVAREIRLDFPVDRQFDPMTTTPSLASVGGEAGWTHDNWWWSFRKCKEGTDEHACW